VVLPASELQESFSRSSGPGGQHVNTSSSRVELRFDVDASQTLTPVQKSRIRDRLGSRMTADGVVVIHASEERSQSRNRYAARRRLTGLLTDALTPAKRRRPTRPTRSARRRRIEAKKRRGQIKKLRKDPRHDS
jgi:ribosome-associated protein